MANISLQNLVIFIVIVVIIFGLIFLEEFVSFNTLVIVIATICLIGTLTFIGYSLYHVQHNTKFPPVEGQCPDHWVAKSGKCINKQGLGNCTDAPDFDAKFYKGPDGKCHKSKWAKNCGVSWTGITNDPNICKNMSS